MRFSTAMHAALDRVADVPGWSLSQAEAAALVVDLTRCETRVAELRLRALAAADTLDVGQADASPSTGTWLAGQTRQRKGGAHADVRFAAALGGEFDATRTALASGSVLVEQARVIVKAVQDLPDNISAETRRGGEAFLLEQAAEFDAKALAVLGNHLLEVLDPEEAERRLGDKLAKEERDAARKVFLTLVDNGDGTTSGRFKVPALTAAMLRKALAALAAPKHTRAAGAANRATSRRMHPDRHPLGADGRGTGGTDRTGAVGGTRTGSGDRPRPDGDDVKLTRPEKLGQALCELIERYPVGKLPKAGGMNATVVVTMTLEQLRGQLEGACLLDTGEHISAGTARRLACAAGVIPAVLGSDSQMLDLGRLVRFHTPPQRTAMTIRDKGCTAEGCDVPAGGCQAHHKIPWSRGGPTNLEDGTLLCPWHHQRAHDRRYRVEYLPSGKTRFHRRT